MKGKKNRAFLEKVLANMTAIEAVKLYKEVYGELPPKHITHTLTDKNKKWEEEFDAFYGDDFNGGFRDKIKNFIRSLLLKKDAEHNRVLDEIVGRITNMKVTTGNAEAKVGAEAMQRAIVSSLDSHRLPKEK